MPSRSQINRHSRSSRESFDYCAEAADANHADALRITRTAGPQFLGQADRLCNAQVAHNTVEEFHILFLDRKNVLITHERQQRGTIDHTPVYCARSSSARSISAPRR